MKTLYTCGCSFMTLDTKETGIRSFLELYAEQKNLKHISLGRSGATNFCIRLQIEEAIKSRADYIIIGTTSSDRIDIPIPEKAKSIRWPITLQDIEYRGYRSSSTANVDSSNPKIISDSINNWTTENIRWVPHDNFRRREINEEVIEAMKHYIAHLHSFQLEQMRDYYIIAEGIRKLIDLNKKFVFMSGPMFYCDWSFVKDSLWTGKQPWDLPYGPDPLPINHNPQQAHNEFLETLLEMTKEWNNT